MDSQEVNDQDPARSAIDRYIGTATG